MNKRAKPPAVWIQPCSFEESAYQRPGGPDGGHYWDSKTLYAAVKEQGCEVFDIPLAALDLSCMPWDVRSIADFAYHMRRIMAANLKHPIVLDDQGFIADGWHRVVQALAKGNRTIKAYRLRMMPDPDRIRDDNFNGGPK